MERVHSPSSRPQQHTELLQPATGLLQRGGFGTRQPIPGTFPKQFHEEKCLNQFKSYLMFRTDNGELLGQSYHD